MTVLQFPERRVLLVPGLNGSGPAHWQSRWQQLFPHFERVEQADWSVPDLETWAARVGEELARSSRPTWIAAHSFGCLAVVRQARFQSPNLAGALLVAPADPHKFGLADALRHARMPCPAILVGSLNDPWMASADAAVWARRWGCAFVNAGRAGHINADSGLGDWADGLELLSCLIDAGDAFDFRRHAAV
ncbi:RBBP9/YdeN family alpha/beta hydrolase [Noviherbaspirillum massiliense]|uniref:RBBP9/YdeN family alpha/beta hydrolase n=1 Tax=Noviherbaspirillum massiliense TaxID=1465823 RepID=UPI0003066689|nr:alpha/beta hydrolase [Noviherbaspirillum massiliense]